MHRLVRSFVLPCLTALALTMTLSACEGLNFDQPLLGGDAVSDSPLVVDVKNALKANAQTTLLRITVTAVEDSIILKGTVNSENEKQTAEQVASSVAGVRVVTNNLYVQ